MLSCPGSRMHQGGKGYVNECRQTETTLMFVNEAAERKKIYSQLPRGEFLDLKQDGIWRHVAGNLDRVTTKATASDFMKLGSRLYRGTVAALPATLAPAERREKEGGLRNTLWHKWQIDEMALTLQRTIERTRTIGRSLGMSR